MTGMIDWATDRARMILVFVAMSLAAGILAYTGLPKEGEPDIDILHYLFQYLSLEYLRKTVKS